MANVLIVDDDKAMLQQIEILIRSFNHSPVTTVFPVHIFDILESESIDLILLDMYMPEIDGLNSLKQLKKHEKYKELPVIMLTSETDEKLMEECFETGAVDFINKPLKEVVIRARLKSVLSNQEYITQLKNVNEEVSNLNSDLLKVLFEIKTLKGLLPICSSCKKIRRDNSYPKKQESWINLEYYITSHTEASFTHSICPECLKKLYPEIHR